MPLPAKYDNLPSHKTARIWQWSIVHEGMLRWHVIPRNNFFNIYLHKFLGPDTDRYPHCHPWPSLSIMLRGWIHEEFMKDKKQVGKNKILGHLEMRSLYTFDVAYRGSEFIHWITATSADLIGKIHGSKYPITLFITWRRNRIWGFYRPVTNNPIEAGHTRVWEFIPHDKIFAGEEK